MEWYFWLLIAVGALLNIALLIASVRIAINSNDDDLVWWKILMLLVWWPLLFVYVYRTMNNR